MSALVIAEHDNNSLKDASRCAVAAARQLECPVSVLVAGENCGAAARAAAALEGVDKVLVCDAPVCAHQLAENIAPLVVGLAEGCTHLLAPATTTGKNLMPRVAALLDAAPISDVIAMEGEDTFKRPIYAGNIIATVQSADAVKVLTVRTTAFDAVSDGSDAAPIEEVPPPEDSGLSAFLEEAMSESERPELTAAKAIISGGRGMGSGENFKLIETIADKLGAAIGASRAAVDAGFVPNDMQVGQTGKIVAPELYIAVGISGAIQHLAGMKDSRVIVAINKDEEAPIFQVADYGLVADLFEALPALEKLL